MAFDVLETGHIKSYNFVREVKNDGFEPGHVIKCCKGQRSTHGGYKWEYRS